MNGVKFEHQYKAFKSDVLVNEESEFLLDYTNCDYSRSVERSLLGHSGQGISK